MEVEHGEVRVPLGGGDIGVPSIGTGILDSVLHDVISDAHVPEGVTADPIDSIFADDALEQLPELGVECSAAGVLGSEPGGEEVVLLLLLHILHELFHFSNE